MVDEAIADLEAARRADEAKTRAGAIAAQKQRELDEIARREHEAQDERERRAAASAKDIAETIRREGIWLPPSQRSR